MGSESYDWINYYDITSGRPARPTLLRALEEFSEPGFAIDLGCGAGNDSIDLLRRGWQVLAVDAEPSAIERVSARAATLGKTIGGLVSTFENLALPTADLVNASYSLPFCSPQHFPKLWETISEALKPGSIFCGNLFGNHDEWANDPSMTFHNKKQVDLLLQNFTILSLKEEESDSQTADKTPKHWHIFHFVAAKRE